MVSPKQKKRREVPVSVRESKLSPLVRLGWKALQRLLVVYPGDVILDAHCMEGTLLKRLSRIYPEAALCGACFTPPQVRRARQLAPKADIMFSDELDLPWMSESIDSAFIARGFHDMDNPLATLHEMHRVLKPGGQIAVAGLWAPKCLCAFWNELIEHTPAARIRTRTEMIETLRIIGFEQVYYTRAGMLGCVVTGLKK